MLEITQALQNAGNARSYNTKCSHQSNWLVENTKVYTAPIEELIEKALTLDLEITEKLNHRTEILYFILEIDGKHIGMIDKPEYQEDKDLCPSGWLMIIDKDLANT